MSRDVGSFDEYNDDHNGINTKHHYRAHITADHHRRTDTDYDELPNLQEDRVYLDSYFVDNPDTVEVGGCSPEEVAYSLEPQTSTLATESEEPDPEDLEWESNWSLSLSAGVGPISISYSMSEDSGHFSDTYEGNQYWLHWEIPATSWPSANDDAYGVSAELDTSAKDGDTEKLNAWTTFTYSWTDVNHEGTYFTDTQTLGEEVEFTVTDDF